MASMGDGDGRLWIPYTSICTAIRVGLATSRKIFRCSSCSTTSWKQSSLWRQRKSSHADGNAEREPMAVSFMINEIQSCSVLRTSKELRTWHDILRLVRDVSNFIDQYFVSLPVEVCVTQLAASSLSTVRRTALIGRSP